MAASPAASSVTTVISFATVTAILGASNTGLPVLPVLPIGGFPSSIRAVLGFLGMVVRGL
jgi:hypothetical protein